MRYCALVEKLIDLRLELGVQSGRFSDLIGNIRAEFFGLVEFAIDDAIMTIMPMDESAGLRSVSRLLDEAARENISKNAAKATLRGWRASSRVVYLPDISDVLTKLLNVHLAICHRILVLNSIFGDHLLFEKAYADSTVLLRESLGLSSSEREEGDVRARDRFRAVLNSFEEGRISADDTAASLLACRTVALEALAEVTVVG